MTNDGWRITNKDKAKRREQNSGFVNVNTSRRGEACWALRNPFYRDLHLPTISGAETQVLSAFLFQFQQRISIPLENRQTVVADIFSLFLSQTLAAQGTELFPFSHNPHIFILWVNNSATDMPVYPADWLGRKVLSWNEISFCISFDAKKDEQKYGCFPIEKTEIDPGGDQHGSTGTK